MFSKTTTNNFLGSSNQGDVMTEYQIPGDHQPDVAKMLDSQASSPTIKSDIALRTTA